MTQLLEARTAAEGVWIGRDVHLIDSYTVEPRSMKEVSVDLARVREETPPSFYKDPDIWSSTRSRYAQWGGQFPEIIDTSLKEALINPIVNTIKVPFLNHSYNSITLDKDQGGVFRLLAGKGPSLTGTKLEEALATGEISVAGKEDDWWLATNQQGAVGIGLYIHNEQWLPPGVTSANTAGETTKTFRKDMSNHLKPITDGDPAVIRIGHTADLFSKRFLAVIDPSIQTEKENTRNVTSSHINSRALYPGYPPKPWHIRTETLSRRDELPHHNDLPRRAIIVSFHPIRNPLPYIPS